MEQYLDKPHIGEACNGCGLCCMIRVCKNGAYVQKLVSTLGEDIPGPCPALVANKNGSYSCGIVLNPKKYIKNSKYPETVLSKNFAILIGAGSGCDELYEDDSFEEEEKLHNILEQTKGNPEWVRRVKIALKVIHGIE